MKKKILSLALSAAMSLGLFAACANNNSSTQGTAPSTAGSEQKKDENAQPKQPSGNIRTIGSGSTRVGSLLGPTSIGLVDMFNDTENNTAKGSYTFTLASQPTDIVSKLASGDLDIALVPANLAATLYNRTKGGVSALDINTGNVLYCVTGDSSIKSIADLEGKTIYSTGQGASPEYVIKYLLDKNGVKNTNLEFKSEASELAAILAENKNAIAILPQPFATVAQAKNSELHSAFSLGDEWSNVSDSSLVTGVTIVRKDFLQQQPDAVSTFVDEHAASVNAVNNDPASVKLVSKYGIIENENIAAKAIPLCSIVSIRGADLKTALSGYLAVLHDANPQSVGGALPGDDFYQ